ncbi:MAG: DNA-binding response regulator [Rhodocyclales bacterium]|nr:DNA-binding response regulator [Rhodocyclales bacterium]
MRLLLLEDDMTVAQGIVEGLARSGMGVDHLESAEPAEGAIALTNYDLVMVDLGLPGMDGLEFIRRIRLRNIALPVLILTARDGLEDRVRGLDIGADDYLLKPFLLPELQARIRALIRRSSATTASEVTFGPLCFNLGLRTATLLKCHLDITMREWEVLQHLILSAPNVTTKQKLADSLSSWDNEISTNAVEIYISRLRGKLQDSGVLIRTVRGIGYRLELI